MTYNPDYLRLQLLRDSRNHDRPLRSVFRAGVSFTLRWWSHTSKRLKPPYNVLQHVLRPLMIPSFVPHFRPRLLHIHKALTHPCYIHSSKPLSSYRHHANVGVSALSTSWNNTDKLPTQGSKIPPRSTDASSPFIFQTGNGHQRP